MMNVGLVLMIFVLIFAILLVEQFAHVGYAGDVHQISNFQHVPVAILTLVKFTTGENWNGYMHDLNANWREGSGCWSKKKFAQIRTKMYAAEAANSNYDDAFGYKRGSMNGGVGWASKETCQAFESYKDCCVPLNGCGDRLWAEFIIRFFDILVTGVVLNLFVGIILSAYDEARGGGPGPVGRGPRELR